MVVFVAVNGPDMFKALLRMPKAGIHLVEFF